MATTNQKKTTKQASKNAKTKTKNLSLSQEKMDKAREMASSIDHTDNDSILSYGLETQRDLGKYSNELLDRVKTKDAGDVGEVINDLMHELNYIDVESMTDKKPFMSRLPVIGPYFDTVKKSLSKFESVSDNINEITVKLDDSRKVLLRDSVTLNNLFEKNVAYIEDMDVTIQAGYLKIQELTDEIIPAKELELKKDPDNQILIQEVNDLSAYMNNLDKKIHDLELSKMVASQSLPQIRMIQANSNNLVEKIQSSVMTVIPLWKNQITTALTLNRQNKILQASKQVTDTTNHLLQSNAMLLKTNTVNIAQQTEESIVSVETVKKTNKMLMETIDEIQKIREDGKTQREKAKKELKASEEELTNKILNHKDKVVGDQKEINRKMNEFEETKTEDGVEFEIPSMVETPTESESNN